MSWTTSEERDAALMEIADAIIEEFRSEKLTLPDAIFAAMAAGLAFGELYAPADDKPPTFDRGTHP